MTTEGLFSLLPLFLLSGFAVILMLLIAIYRDHNLTFWFTLAGFTASFASLFFIQAVLPRQIVPILIIDNYALLYWGMIILASSAVAVLSYNYLKEHEEQKEEYYILLMTATLGACTMSSASHFISFFLGLEILSVSLYTMISYLRDRLESVEAGLKYLVLAAASSAFLLFGMALVYASTGTMEFARISESLSANGVNALTLSGFAMMVIAVGFKLALAPFHMWTPDVYQGAPAPVTAFVATVSKAGMFGLWLRFFVMINGYRYGSLLILFTVISIASMFTGNFLALMQNNVKRILAYSSIAHLGYLFVAFLAGGKLAIEATTFYLVAYIITSLGTFGIVTVLSGKMRDAEDIEDYRGLYWRRPLVATVFTAMLMSLAGIPLTAGFIGKFYLVSAAVNSWLWLPVIILVINSAISVYYYLRIIVVMYRRIDEVTPAVETTTGTLATVGPVMQPSISLGGGLVLAVLTLALIWVGVFPGNIIQFIKDMVSSLSSAAMPMHTAQKIMLFR
ncbi:MAG: NADH-quinone oxidoreductase subunit N [Bacteroidota bacterium]|nr:NADH-quinone oxidoreductase subunit N [Bacteroidota bacterium]